MEEDGKRKRMTALDGAVRKGALAFKSGQSRSGNPYGDQRTWYGGVTWARAFYKAWDDGWTEEQKREQQTRKEACQS